MAATETALTVQILTLNKPLDACCFSEIRN